MSESKLSRLIELASESSSESRRSLLREVTDLFFNRSWKDGPEAKLFDAIISRLASDMEEAVRVELAERLVSQGERAPRLLVALANDVIEVARPILTNGALSEQDQIHVARLQSQDHLRALSERTDVSVAVTGAIIERADDNTIGVLAANPTAQLSRNTVETIVARASVNEGLHEVVVNRHNLPADLLNGMYFVVEARLRHAILSRNSELDPRELDAILAAGRKRVASEDGALPDDFVVAENAVRRMRLTRALTAESLVVMWRAGEITKFTVALAQLTELDFQTARSLIERRELDVLAVICKAAEFSRAIFVTLAVLILGRDSDPIARAQEYGDLYQRLPKNAADQTLRFWRMRRHSGELAA